VGNEAFSRRRARLQVLCCKRSVSSSSALFKAWDSKVWGSKAWSVGLDECG
jgi:hypothetical protein